MGQNLYRGFEYFTTSEKSSLLKQKLWLLQFFIICLLQSFTPFLCLNRMRINAKQFLDLLFGSPYLKAQLSFFDCLWFLVCLSACKLFTFFTSPEPLVQFQPKLTQISPGKGVLSLFKWRATWQSNAKIMNPDQSHTCKWKTIQNECMANTDPWIYQRWDQVHRRSKILCWPVIPTLCSFSMGR